jgi:hypothetical protein
MIEKATIKNLGNLEITIEGSHQSIIEFIRDALKLETEMKTVLCEYERKLKEKSEKSRDEFLRELTFRELPINSN